MLKKYKTTLILLTSILAGCTKSTENINDPYEHFNRRVYKFNHAVDVVCLKPAAQIYTTFLPAKVRSGINNVYNNINMLPTVANDLLQTEWHLALRDTWRFIANSTIGIGGIFDPASRMSLPAHSNDLGITFAKWGDKNSPYIVIPLLGPSTFRDGMGILFDYTLFSPYPYLHTSGWIEGALALRYVDLRSQMLDTEKLMADAIDPYTFMRDAYLQHRNYLINGEQPENGELYIDEQPHGLDPNILPETPANKTPSPFPITSA
jgi:phospholipid-binding lipoprotein MlaA